MTSPLPSSFSATFSTILVLVSFSTEELELVRVEEEED
jgi:hypothetical protein